MTTGTWQIRGCAVIVVALGTLAGPASAADPTPQPTFASPSQAVDALLAAMRGGKAAEMIGILGPRGEDIVSSGDPVADQNAEAKFIAAYGEMNKIVLMDKDNSRAQLRLGSDEWPFTVPLVKVGAVWRFDSAAGLTEILDRRIGRNELNAIEVCRTYVEAQNEYADADRLAGGLLEYAQKIRSTPGKHDGLYWPAAADEEKSPLGPLVASARAEGYDTAGEGDGKPYHGYRYKILTRQGKAASGGARDYVAKGHMIGGFALLAFPARYGDSGIMTFIVSHDGVVYQKNLGPETATVAGAISEFNPDQGWTKQ